jgi:transposase
MSAINVRITHPPAQRLRPHIVQCDGYAPYGKLPTHGCLLPSAGATRDASSSIAAEAVARIAQIYAIERDLRDASADARRAARQARSRPLIDVLNLKMLFEHQLARLSGGSDTAKIIRYGLRHWDGLTASSTMARARHQHRRAFDAAASSDLTRKNALFAGHDDDAEN